MYNKTINGFSYDDILPNLYNKKIKIKSKYSRRFKCFVWKHIFFQLKCTSECIDNEKKYTENY
jgi:hypothetical protein